MVSIYKIFEKKKKKILKRIIRENNRISMYENRALIFVIIRISVVDITQTTDTKPRRDRAALAFRDGKLINSGISTGRNRIKA